MNPTAFSGMSDYALTPTQPLFGAMLDDDLDDVSDEEYGKGGSYWKKRLATLSGRLERKARKGKWDKCREVAQKLKVVVARIQAKDESFDPDENTKAWIMFGDDKLSESQMTAFIAGEKTLAQLLGGRDAMPGASGGGFFDEVHQAYSQGGDGSDTLALFPVVAPVPVLGRPIVPVVPGPRRPGMDRRAHQAWAQHRAAMHARSQARGHGGGRFHGLEDKVLTEFGFNPDNEDEFGLFSLRRDLDKRIAALSAEYKKLQMTGPADRARKVANRLNELIRQRAELDTLPEFKPSYAELELPDVSLDAP